MKATVVTVAWIGVVTAWHTGTSCADIFKLTCGGQLQGVWAARDQKPVEQYEIRLRGGGRIVLAPAAVKEVIRQPALEQQYQLFVIEHGNDIADHWAIAQWCREHGLKQQRRYHLERILRLDTDHVEARRALGYSFVGGHWRTQDEFMRQRGYMPYKGHWELPQQVGLLEARRKREVAERQWYRQISLWRRELATDRADEFCAAIASIDDPLAIPALVLLIQREVVRPVRLLYVASLAGIGTPEAQHSLLDIILTDFDEEVIHGCLEYLVKVRSPSIHQRLLKTLRHENNAFVNRAAVALEQLGEDESVGALIDALVTQHAVPVYNRQADQYELVPVDIENRDVLSTLVALTGAVGYGYNEKVWKQWRFQQVKQAHAARTNEAPLRRNQSR